MITKTWKQPKCLLTDDWIKTIWYTYTVEYSSTLEKKEILPFTAMWMNLEDIMISEISQIHKDKYHMISCVESKKDELIETESRMVATMGCGGGGNEEMLVRGYKLPVIRQ